MEANAVSADHILKTFLAGGVSTCCAKTSTAPLERLKILFQAQNVHFKDMGVFHALRTIYHKEGPLGYYKGNGALMLRVFPYGALQFVSYEQYKKILTPLCDNCAASKLISGSLAGLTACTLTYPLDVVRSRLAFQVADEEIYCGVCHAIQQIFTTEGGFCALYKGYGATAVSMIPAVGFGFLAYETFKEAMLAIKGTLTKTNKETGETVLSPLGGLVCGAMAGASSQTVAYPLDVVRRRMQLAGAVADGHKYSGCISTFVTVYTEDGLRKGLYRGLSINYMRVVPQVAVMFSVYEIIKQVLNDSTVNDRSE